MRCGVNPLCVLCVRQEIEQLITDVMRYTLFAHSKRLPVKMTDINKHILKERCKGGGKLLMAEARKRFAHTYGFDLIEVIPSKERATKAAAAAAAAAGEV